VAGKDVVNHIVSNNPPQAQNPVAKQPAPTLNKGPKDPNAKDPNALGPDGKDLTGLFPGDDPKDPKDPKYKDLYPDNGKGKDFTGLPGVVKDTEGSEQVEEVPASSIKRLTPEARRKLIEDKIMGVSPETLDRTIDLLEVLGGTNVKVGPLNTRDGWITRKEAQDGLRKLREGLASGDFSNLVKNHNLPSYLKGADYAQLLPYFERLEQVATILVENSGTIAGLDGVSDTIGPADLAALSPLLAPNQSQPRQQPNPSNSVRNTFLNGGFQGVRLETLKETIAVIENFADFGIKDHNVSHGNVRDAISELNRILDMPVDEAVIVLERKDRVLGEKLGRRPTYNELITYYTRIREVADQVNSNLDEFSRLGGDPTRLNLADLLALQKLNVTAP